LCINKFGKYLLLVSPDHVAAPHVAVPLRSMQIWRGKAQIHTHASE